MNVIMASLERSWEWASQNESDLEHNLEESKEGGEESDRERTSLKPLGARRGGWRETLCHEA